MTSPRFCRAPLPAVDKQPPSPAIHPHVALSPSMSGSIRKDHFFTLGIHKVPANVSRKDFEVKVDALMDDLAAVPLARTNFVRFNLVRTYLHWVSGQWLY
ncbi:hypothetical protein B0H19DRAFT_1258973 [Mycena capillaripes]|nr:hypothetical protein B0H19DRAFT_1258973 [Mycena capillaripes]